ncbi:MAG: cytochrome P450 [Candidatus Eremiobacteraeota bacterium]|nr:cytochrome P450 [Candidatus Eremiobacteraeota bacterium]
MLSIDTECLTDWLLTVAQRSPEQLAYTFLAEGQAVTTSLTYAELAQRCDALAGFLLERGMAGRNVVLVFPPGPGFIVAFLGCLRAGAVAVPQPLPRANRENPAFDRVLQDTRTPLVLTCASQAGRLSRVLDGQVHFEVLEDILVDARPGGDFPKTSAGDLAFLQYTSGSTGEPKGVMVSNGNLVHNQLAIQESMGHRPGLTMVGWLPHFHDMGLVGNLLQPLAMGGHLVFMPPAAFAQAPGRWLEAISKYRADTSGGPNFAYELCVEKITEEQKKGLDLSHWSVAFVGAEPVHASTLERFTRAFAGCGFRPEAWFPCYGMAETTLLASGRHGLKTTSIGYQALRAHRFQPCADTETTARRAVSCGTPPAQGRIAILSLETEQAAAPGEIGEILISSGSVTRGYWQKPELSAARFQVSLEGDPAVYLRTGDLGAWHDQELYVLGRLKEMLILRGHNYYPGDIENSAAAAHPSLEPGAVAALGIAEETGERLVLLAEVKRTHLQDLDPAAVAQTLAAAVAEDPGLPVQEVVFLKPGNLARTTSGKVQHAACRDLYLENRLDPVYHWIRQETPPTVEEAPSETVTRQSLLEADADLRRQLLITALRQCVARLAGCSSASLDPDQELRSLGLDSMQLFEVKLLLDDLTGQEMDLDAFLDVRSLTELADRSLDEAKLAQPSEPFLGNLSGRMHRPAHFAPGPNDVEMPAEHTHMSYDFLGWLQEVVHKHGEVVRLKLGNQRLFVLSHPEDAAGVLIAKSDIWIRGRVWEPFQSAMGQHGIVTGEGPLWKEQRSLAQPEFSHASVMAHRPQIARVVSDNHRAWAERGEPFDLLQSCKRLTLEVILQRLFGHLADSAMVDGLFAVVRDIDQFWNVPSVFLYGNSEGALTQQQQWEERVQQLDRQLAPWLSQIRPEGLLARYSAPRDAAATFLLAGFDTTAAGLYWTMDQLLAHPEALARVQQEVRDPDWSERSPWLMASIHEAMRLYPPVWFMGREAIADTHLGGYVVPAGSFAVTSPYLIHRNPRVWPQPHQFRPERFIGTPVPARNYMPFGLGVRMCIGKHLALTELALAVGQLLRDYRLEVVESGDRRHPSDFTLAPRRALQIRLSRLEI